MPAVLKSKIILKRFEILISQDDEFLHSLSGTWKLNAKGKLPPRTITTRIYIVLENYLSLLLPRAKVSGTA